MTANRTGSAGPNTPYTAPADWLVQNQRALLQSAVDCSGAMLQWLGEVQKVQGAWQSMFNGQLPMQNWPGASKGSQAADNRELLSAWGRAQDSLLEISRSWIDALQATQTNRN